MTRTPLLLAFVAAAALAGCHKENHTIVAGGADETNAAGPAKIELPPAIVATKTYRCADNSVVHVDWLSDGKSANVRTDAGGTVQVTAPEAGQAMTGGTGYSVAGTADAATAKIATGGAAQSCKA